jgi:hypothetical protein
MTKQDLIDNGFVSLTEPYIMPREDEIFSRAAKQLEEGGDPHYFLWSEERDTVEIWTIPSKPVEAE